MRRHLLRSLCALTFAIAGCGGGGGSTGPATTDTLDAHATPEPDTVIAYWEADADAVPGEPDAPAPVEETTTGPTEPDAEGPAPEPDVAVDTGGSTEPDTIEEVAKPNGAPVAVDDHSATFAGEVLHVEVRRNDTDPDDDELSIVAVTDGAFGTVAITDGGVKVGQRVTYTPNDAVSLGIDSFTYTIEDPEGLQDTATVTIHQVQFQDGPVLTILSPAHGEVIDADTVTISFEVAGCYFTSPAVEQEGCHGHKWVDGEKWLEQGGSGLGHYNTSTFDIGPLTDGLHVLEFYLHKNDGTDGAWDPEVVAEVSFEINGGYLPPDEPVEPVEVNVPILSVQPAAEAGQLLMGTTNGVWRTQGEDTALAIFFGPTVTALARDPFSVSTYHASGQWPAAGYELWGLATSMNGGESWAETSLQNTAMFDDLAVGTDQAGFIAGIFASQVHVSADAGVTWETTPLTVWVDDLVFASTDPVVLYLAGPTGLQSLSWDTGEVTSLGEQPVTAIDRVGQQIAYVTTDLLIHLCDGALSECTTWSTPTTDTIIQLVSEMADPSVMYVLTNQHQIFKSDNGGETWVLLIDGGP